LLKPIQDDYELPLCVIFEKSCFREDLSISVIGFELFEMFYMRKATQAGWLFMKKPSLPSCLVAP
jgi:hypothetical protein